MDDIWIERDKDVKRERKGNVFHRRRDDRTEEGLVSRQPYHLRYVPARRHRRPTQSAAKCPIRLFDFDSLIFLE